MTFIYGLKLPASSNDTATAITSSYSPLTAYTKFLVAQNCIKKLSRNKYIFAEESYRDFKVNFLVLHW